MSQYLYLNGAIVELAKAAIHPYDAGLLHGAGLFETMAAVNGKVFRFGAHRDRLLGSARALGMPFTEAQLPTEMDFESLLARNELHSGRCRLLVTAGRVGSETPSGEVRPTVLGSAVGQTGYPAEQYEKGIRVMISQFQQNPQDPTTGHKTTNYLSRLIALSQATRQDCREALWFTPDRRLAEGSISNVFLVKDGALATPPLDTPVLPGIARATVMEIAAAEGISCAEKPLTINELLDADEVFLTNSIMEVMPVTRIENGVVGDGNPGPISQGLRASYRAIVERECAK